MKSSKINYVVVGGFVLAMVAGLVVAVALLTGQTGPTDSYFAVYRNVTGVKFGTQVLYEGYPIGQVESVTPEPVEGRMRFRVDFEVTKGWRIPGDSVAEIAAPGLLAAITLSIRAGSSDTALEPGSEVEGLESANVFAVLSSVAAEVTDLAQTSLKPLLANLNDAVGSFSKIMDAEGQTLITEITTMTRDLAERTPRIADNFEALIARLDKTTGHLAELLRPENRKQLENILDDMDVAAGNFAKLTTDLEETRLKFDELVAAAGDVVTDNKEDLEKSLSDLRYVADSVARHIDSVNQNMEGAARNMYEFTRQIRQNPGLLLGGQPPEDAGARR